MHLAQLDAANPSEAAALAEEESVMVLEGTTAAPTTMAIHGV